MQIIWRKIHQFLPEYLGKEEYLRDVRSTESHGGATVKTQEDFV